MKKKDESLGFAIYAVSGSSIEQSTWTQISTAKLGSSNSVQKGDAVAVLESHLAMQERSDLERLRTAEMNWMQMTEVISSFALILVRQKTEQV